MQQLIKIETNEKGTNVVSARELHYFLESRQQFTNWIQNRIEQYGFIENQDFEVFNNSIKNPNGGRPLTEYALTIDCAKELAMLEGNSKGKQARQYFLECERKAQNPIANITRLDMAKMLLAAEEEKEAERIAKEAAQKQLELDAPKVLFANALTESKDTVLVKELATFLNQNGIDIGQNRLFVWLREKGYLCTKGESYNLPTQRAMDLKLFEVKKTSIVKPNGTILTTNTTKVTGRGLQYFLNKFLTQSKNVA